MTHPTIEAIVSEINKRHPNSNDDFKVKMLLAACDTIKTGWEEDYLDDSTQQES